MRPQHLKSIFLANIISLILTLLFVQPASAQDSPDKLKPNEPLERRIKGGETQEFQFKLRKGDFARVEVVPTGIDVVVSMIDADGKTLIEMDGDANYLWRESISSIAEKNGTFKFQIKSKGKPETAGNFTVKLAEQRKSVALDGKRVEAEKTLVQAIKLNQENKQPESAKLYETSLNLWREVGDKYWEAVTMWNLAYAYFLFEDYKFSENDDRVLKLFDQAFLVFQNLNDRIGESNSLSGIGNVHRSAQKYDLAKDFLEKGLVIRRELKRLRSEYNSLNALILVYQKLNLDNKIFENLGRMLEISKERKNREDEFDVNYRLGLFYSIQKQNETALPFLNRAIEIAKELQDNKSEVTAILVLGGIYQQLAQFEAVRKKYEEALEIAKKVNDKNIESNILNEYGKFYVLSLCDYGGARELLLKALKAKREFKNDKQGELDILGGLALISQGLGEFEKLIELSKDGLNLSRETKNKNYENDFLDFLGIGFQNTGKIDDALKYFEQALKIAQDEKLIFKEVITIQHISGYYVVSQNYQEAKRLREKALLIAEDSKNSRLIGSALHSLGSVNSNLAQYTEAQKYYERALEIARNSNDKQSESNTLLSLGLLFEKLGQSDKAITYLEDSLNTQDQQSTCNQLYVLSSIGTLKSNQNRIDEAVKYYEQALKLAEETKNIYWKSTLLMSLGGIYSRLNQYEKAQKYFELSLSLSQKSKIIPNVGIALLSLGGMYYRLNQYEKSRDYYLQLEKLAKDTKNKWLLGFVASGTGAIYTDLSNNQTAQTNLQQSLTVFREVFDRNSEGGVLNTIGNTYLNQKDYENARKYYEQSIAIAKELKNKQSEIYPLINLGAVFQNKKQLDQAQDFYRQGLSLAIEIKDRTNEGYALNGLGAVYFNFKKYKEAEDFYRQSLAIAGEVQSKKLEASVLQNLMDLFNEIKKPQIAIAYGKQAVNIFQQIRGNIKSFEKESQQSYVEDKEAAYRTLAGLLIAQERFPEAQAVLNLLKDEEFAQLARDGEKSEIVPYSSIEARLLDLSEKLSDLQAKYDGFLKIENPSDEQKRQSENTRVSLNEANEAFDAALKDLEKSEKSVVEPVDSFFKNKNLKGALTDLREMSGSGVVALYTLIGRDETTENKNVRNEKTKFGWVIMITEKGHRAYPIDVTNFNELVFQLKGALSSDEYDPQSVAQKLYNAIFRQKSVKRKRTLEQDLQEYLAPYQNKTLMWSLDGVLRYIPMSALHDDKDYLAEKYLNSVFTEKSIISLVKENRPNWKILGLGVSEQRGNFAALPGVKIELETIVREENSPTGILSGAIRLNENFTKESFFRTLGRREFSVIHIASHYSFKPEAQAESFLLMGDGNLSFGELKDENLFGAVDLLTLSACETGVSGNGKETEGFPVKAQELGAKSVIASLWKVSDAGTPELMIRFYKLRADNPPMAKGEAFRRAQLSLLGAGGKAEDKTAGGNRSEIVGLSGKKIELPLFVKDEAKPFAHPHYWSSFVLIGNWR